jgi:APA family basic amino acid/polyamine antiporter
MSEQDAFARMKRRAHEADGVETLKRTLSGAQLVLLGIGAIIGVGIFVATGPIAAHNAGPAVVYSFVLAAAACLCAGLCYAEFAAMFPVSGSAYSYVYAAFGPAAAWMVGWCLILEYLMGAACVAVAWAGYTTGLLRSLGMTISPALTSSPFGVSPAGTLYLTGASVNALAVAVLVSLTILVACGARASVRMNALLVVTKLTLIGLFIVIGARYVNLANWRPFVPTNTGEFGSFGWSGVLRGAGVAFYAFLGFDMVSAAARETRNPQRAMPVGIIGSLLVCTAVYIGFALVLTGLAPYRLLGATDPVGTALDHASPLLQPLKIAVEFGAIVGLTSAALVTLFALSRILFAMARDGLVPKVFGRIGAGSGTPLVAVLVCGLIPAVAAGLFPIEALAELISIGTLIAFVFVCSGVLFLRRARPDLDRPFQTPFVTFVCAAGILICIFLALGLPVKTWLRFLSWTAVGAGIFALYGRRHCVRGSLTGGPRDSHEARLREV